MDMETNHQENRPAGAREEKEQTASNQANQSNAHQGGQAAPKPEAASSEEERVAIQASRAEQPEPDTHHSPGKATDSHTDPNEIINNTGDDISNCGSDADAASG